MSGCKKKTITVDITTGLVAFYPFNGNANDESGNGANGSVNGAKLAADRFGNPNKAYSFGGSDFISSNPKGLPINNSARSFTAFIFYQNTPSYNDWSCILSYGGDYAVPGTINDLFIGLSTADRIYMNHGEYGVTSTPASSYSGKWIHVAVVYDGINLSNIRIFINGVEQPATSFNNRALTQLTTVNGMMTIGRTNLTYGGNRNFYFKGLIDDVRVYNRALTKEQVEYLAKN